MSVIQQETAEGFLLSPQQKRVWLLQQSGGAPYRVQCAALIEGDLNESWLKESLERVVERHESLRTTIRRVEGLAFPLQVIGPTNFGWVSLSAPHASGAEELRETIGALLGEAMRTAPDFEAGPPLHVSLLNLSPTRHALLLTAAAVCCDRIGLKNLLREVARTYETFREGRGADDGEALQYADVCEYLNGVLESEETEAGVEFWHAQVASSEPGAGLGFETQTAEASAFSPRLVRREIPTRLFAKTEECARRYGAKPSDFLSACWQVLCRRLSGRTRLVVGTQFDGMSFGELDELPGLFGRYLPVVSDLDGALPFHQLVGRVAELSAQLAEWQDHFSFEQVWPALDYRKSPPFFHVCFESDEGPFVFANGDLTFSVVEQYGCIDRFGIKLSCVCNPAAPFVEFHYDARLLSAVDAEAVAESFQALLEHAVEQPEIEIGRLRTLGDDSRCLLLHELNRTRVEHLQDKQPHQLLEENAARAPHREAVIFGERRMTYAELNARANRVARRLRRLGVEPGVPVAVCMERAPELVVAVMGVLKAGGAFVPLDPESPAERLDFVLTDTRAVVLLTQERLKAKLSRSGLQVICLDSEWEAMTAESAEDFTSGAGGDDLAYVIYTSGSTGRPKGVMIPRRGLANYLNWCVRAYGVAEGQGVPLHSSIGFDLTITSLLAPLVAGTAVVLSAEGEAVESLSGSLSRGRDFSLLKLTPAHLKLLAGLKDGDAVAGAARVLVVGGEALFSEQLSFWRAHAPETKIVNEYGPTETTVGCCVFEVGPGAVLGPAVPIGGPIANTQVYILDENFEPVPFNAVGELYVGGDGLARGYLGRPDLTAEKFLPNPFSAEPGARLYRTGDLARRRPDGNIDFLGRIDRQVKIRGYRIEPGEIESALRQHGGVRNAVVVVREDAGEKRLAAYVVTEGDGAMDMAGLLAHLERKLPGYMIPSVFTQLKELPLTPGGKIDYRALPPPDSSRPMLETAYAPPRTPLEEMLADWWRQALLIERVGIRDDFFALGGDSILSIQIANRAQEAGIRLTPRRIYLHRTIAELAPHLQTDAAIERGPVTGEVPLTPIQHWFFEQEVAEPHHWNQAMLFESSREVKPELLEEALKHVIAHHDALRSGFVRSDSGWCQSIAPPDERPRLTRLSLDGLAIHEQERAAEQLASRLQSSLELSGGELFRAALVEFGAGRPSRLLLVIHHLVVDIVSWGVLLNSLELAYQQLSNGETVELASKTASYKEWAERLAEYAHSGELMAESAYWTADARLKAGRLPLDYPSGVNTEGSVRALRVSLSAEETERLLRVVPKTYHTMINDVLLTALVQAFARRTQSRTLLVDLENHGREELFEGLEVSRTIGWFTCIFPLLLDLGHATAPGDAVRSIKEQIRGVPNGGIGYGLLRYLSGADDVKRLLRTFPEAEISFNYVGRIHRPYAEASLWRPVNGPLGRTRSPLARRRYLLDVAGGVNRRGELEMDWLYSENLHRRATIQSLAEGFVESLRAIIAHCVSKETEVYTPSDFLTGTDLDQGQLDHLMLTYAEPNTQP